MTVRPDLVDLSGMTDDESFEYGRKIYGQFFLDENGLRGVLQTHDAMSVVFYADRYDHAFRTSPDRARRAYDKSKVARERIERIGWIQALLEQRGNAIVCKEQTPPPRWKRAYYCFDNQYVVWLEPLKIVDGRPVGWKFSSAYPLPVSEFKRVAHGFKTVA